MDSAVDVFSAKVSKLSMQLGDEEQVLRMSAIELYYHVSLLRFVVCLLSLIFWSVSSHLFIYLCWEL